nr:Tic22 family protein [Gloeothece citriformis]
MKSIFRWSAALGLVSSTLLTPWLGGNFKALALPEQQIIERLQAVPVFTLADDKGVPLVAVVENDQKVTGVFISQEDAKAFLEQLKKDNPQVAEKVKVQPVSLGQVYKLQNSQKEPDGLIVSYVPDETEVESAKKLLSESGKEYQGGVPLFVAKAGEDQGYLTINQNNQQVIPMFFEKASVTAMVEQFKKQKPDLASTVKIEVIPLESVIETLESSDDQMLNKIVLVPSQETMNFIRANLPNQNNQKK